MRRKWEPRVLRCKDPERCDEMHNEGPGESSNHHYGCECEDCVEWYRRLK